MRLHQSQKSIPEELDVQWEKSNGTCKCGACPLFSIVLHPRAFVCWVVWRSFPMMARCMFRLENIPQNLSAANCTSWIANHISQATWRPLRCDSVATWQGLSAPNSQWFLRFLRLRSMLHCDLRVRWKVASDLWFRAAISEPEAPSFCGISGDLAALTRKFGALRTKGFTSQLACFCDVDRGVQRFRGSSCDFGSAILHEPVAICGVGH